MAAVDAKKKPTNKPDAEWSKNGTCLNRPDEGWIHAGEQLENDLGVSYIVRYVGCMEVVVSMKTLDFENRTAVARESISRVAEAAGLKTGLKKKKDKKILKYLGEAPNLSNAGKDVTLTIKCDSVSMVTIDTGEPFLNHSMEEISFASGGDAETTDFVAYVAKDSANNRACHVLECSGSIASKVIVTIAQAFELRYKQMLKKKKQPVVLPDRQVDVQEESAWGDEEPTYYNESAQISEIKHTLESNIVIPPPIPPLPDNYSARPNDLPIASNGIHSESHTASPLYENTPKNLLHGGNDSPRNERWFHGKLSRNDAERRLVVDGDFLVRESSNKDGQYVLSGMRNGIVVHLLLVDPQGMVRTKDRVFDSVSHLVTYHKDNHVPILSQEIELYLTNPVFR